MAAPAKARRPPQRPTALGVLERLAAPAEAAPLVARIAAGAREVGRRSGDAAARRAVLHATTHAARVLADYGRIPDPYARTRALGDDGRTALDRLLDALTAAAERVELVVEAVDADDAARLVAAVEDAEGALGGGWEPAPPPPPGAPQWVPSNGAVLLGCFSVAALIAWGPSACAGHPAPADADGWTVTRTAATTFPQPTPPAGPVPAPAEPTAGPATDPAADPASTPDNLFAALLKEPTS